jgi:hypothetical protein
MVLESLKQSEKNHKNDIRETNTRCDLNSKLLEEFPIKQNILARDSGLQKDDIQKHMTILLENLKKEIDLTPHKNLVSEKFKKLEEISV